jgi:Mg2+ and Co2+ transporter CorA
MQAFLSTIEEARHEVLSLIRLLSGKTAILRRFNNHQNGGSNAGEELDEKSVKRGTERQSLQGNDIRLYIDDVQDHVSTMLSSLNQFEGLLSRSQNNYVAQLSIDNLEGRRKVNDFMGKIALVTVILTLLNFISGLFGQNVNANIVFYVDNNSYLPFALILSGEAIVAGTVLYGARSYRLF